MDKIELKKTDPTFKDLVAEKIGLEAIKPCYACGSCTGICPVRAVVEDFDPRRIIHMIILGMKRDVLSSDLIWFCCLCNACYGVCPQGIRFSRVALELQQMAVSGGYISENALGGLKNVNDLLQDVCRRMMFQKVKEGFLGSHTMPCWRTGTNDGEQSDGR